MDECFNRVSRQLFSSFSSFILSCCRFAAAFICRYLRASAPMFSTFNNIKLLPVRSCAAPSFCSYHCSRGNIRRNIKIKLEHCLREKVLYLQILVCVQLLNFYLSLNNFLNTAKIHNNPDLYPIKQKHLQPQFTSSAPPREYTLLSHFCSCFGSVRPLAK